MKRVYNTIKEIVTKDLPKDGIVSINGVFEITKSEYVLQNKAKIKQFTTLQSSVSKLSETTYEYKSEKYENVWENWGVNHTFATLGRNSDGSLFVKSASKFTVKSCNSFTITIHSYGDTPHYSGGVSSYDVYVDGEKLASSIVQESPHVTGNVVGGMNFCFSSNITKERVVEIKNLNVTGTASSTDCELKIATDSVFVGNSISVKNDGLELVVFSKM